MSESIIDFIKHNFLYVGDGYMYIFAYDSRCEDDVNYRVSKAKDEIGVLWKIPAGIPGDELKEALLEECEKVKKLFAAVLEAKTAVEEE